MYMYRKTRRTLSSLSRFSKPGGSAVSNKLTKGSLDFRCKIGYMPQTINILFIAAEAEPFVKVGGLGDVAGTLPRALRSLSAEDTGEVRLDVRLVLPLHSVIRQDSLRPVGIYSIPRGESEIQVEAFEGLLEGMPVYFINGEPVRASGSVYSSNNKLDAEKYVFFSLA